MDGMDSQSLSIDVDASARFCAGVVAVFAGLNCTKSGRRKRQHSADRHARSWVATARGKLLCAGPYERSK